MILNQHKEAIIVHRFSQNRIPNRNLDEQEIENINMALLQSQVYKKSVQLTIYDEFNPRSINGLSRHDKEISLSF
ncbi:YolD-like family protein [Paenibacillus sp. HWE-109]|uniref:YolD-like family protein n=1 Tax=Paenibacillus sp. HWE-109 TaxID=1306526 RepID=UPI003FCD91E7